eukprot:SAG31_NODE_3343_length_4381_cov_12.838393_4_plen_218_part_00
MFRAPPCLISWRGANVVCRRLDECCRPLLALLSVCTSASYSFTAEAVWLLESTDPEAVARMKKFSEPMFGESKDGKVASKQSGFVGYDGAAKAKPALTQTVQAMNWRAKSSSSMMVGIYHFMQLVAFPFSTVIPTDVRQKIEADPTCDLAMRYRDYVRTNLVPQISKMSDILNAHAVTLGVCTGSSLPKVLICRISVMICVLCRWCFLPQRPHRRNG